MYLSHGQPLIVFLFANRHVGILLLGNLLCLDFGIHSLVLFILGIHLLVLFVPGIRFGGHGGLVVKALLLAHSFLLMSVPVACLGERLTTELTFERHVVIVYTKMVSEIAELWELQWALLTLQYLIHPFSVAVESMDQKVVSLVNDLLVANQHGSLAL